MRAVRSVIGDATRPIGILLFVALACHTVAYAQTETRANSAGASDSQALDAAGREDAIRLDVTIGTDFPLDIGGGATVELPYRILLDLRLGWMPSGYVSVINATATAAGWYDDTTASLVEASIENSFILRASAGWRPFEELGFEFWIGYTLATAGGGLSGSEIVRAATGQDVQRAGREIPLHATLHALHVSVGWRFVFDWFVLRAAVGWVHTVGSSTSIGGDNIRPDAPLERALTAAEDYMDVEVFRAYGFSPLVEVALGVRAL